MTYVMANKGQCSYIKFYPHLQDYFKSSETVLLIGKLEYWFSKEKFKGGFFKFLEPCPHRLCKPGDTWAEELGWKRTFFKKIFDTVGVRYTSKTAYLEAVALGYPFKGKLYASFYDRKTNQTFFVRNHDFVNQLFEQLQANFSTNQEKLEGGKGKKRLTNTQKNKDFFAPSRQYSTGVKCQSFIYTKKNTNILSPEPVEKKLPVQKIYDFKKEEKMIKIWKEEIKDFPQSMISHKLKIELAKTLKEFFKDSLEEWQGYCQKIASSKFLMGEESHFTPWLSWAIKSHTIQRIQENGFTFGDRKVIKQDLDFEKKRQFYDIVTDMRDHLLEEYGYIGAKEAGLRWEVLDWIKKGLHPDDLASKWQMIQKNAQQLYGLTLPEYNLKDTYHSSYLRCFIEVEIAKEKYDVSK